MKTITHEDLKVGNTLACVFDADQYGTNWAGRVLHVGRISNMGDYACAEIHDPISGMSTNICINDVLRPDMTFVNYDEMTDKEKFLFHISGKVDLD